MQKINWIALSVIPSWKIWQRRPRRGWIIVRDGMYSVADKKPMRLTGGIETKTQTERKKQEMQKKQILCWGVKEIKSDQSTSKSLDQLCRTSLKIQRTQSPRSSLINNNHRRYLLAPPVLWENSGQKKRNKAVFNLRNHGRIDRLTDGEQLL